MGPRETQAVRHSISCHFRPLTLASVGPRQASDRFRGLPEAGKLYTRPKASSVQRHPADYLGRARPGQTQRGRTQHSGGDPGLGFWGPGCRLWSSRKCRRSQWITGEAWAALGGLSMDILVSWLQLSIDKEPGGSTTRGPSDIHVLARASGPGGGLSATPPTPHPQ